MMFAAALLGGGTVAVLVDTDGDGPNPPKQVTVKIPTATGQGDGLKDRIQQIDGGGNATGVELTTRERSVEIPKALHDAIKRSEVAEHAGSRDETPAQAQRVAPGQLKKAQAQQNRIRRTQEPLPTAGASAGFAGCVTRFVRNQSGRNGVRPQLQVLHYTVSPNRPGWGDVNSIVSYFNGGGSQASSHFVIDREGHCAYIVPIEAKSWTQASANPIAVSYEIINSGREGTFLDTAGYNKLRSVMAQVSRRTGIPMRRGRASGCGVSVRGIVQHKDFGICGGGHVDITPYSVDQVTKIVTAGASAAISVRRVQPAHERQMTDRRLYHWKGYHQSKGALKASHLKWSGVWKGRARHQKGRLDAAHRAGQSWKTNSLGTRRLLLAKTERLNQADRKYLRR